MGIFGKKKAGEHTSASADETQVTKTSDGDEIPPGAIRTDEEPPPWKDDHEDRGGWHDQSEPKDYQGKKRGAFFVLKRTITEFGEDRCTDMAAALTYYSVFAIFPAMIAVLSMIGFVGNPERVINKVVSVVEPLVSTKTAETVQKTLDGLSTSGGASLAAIVGILLALWSASAYVNAFSRMMNQVYEVEEGRSMFTLRPKLLLVTLVTVVLIVIAAIILVVSGPVAKSVGDVLGMGDNAVQLWNILKWPVLALIVIAVVAILYHTTPNVKMPKFRIISAGSVSAIVVMVIASVGFAFYVANFSNYNKTYGSLAGVIIFLLWLWIINVVLLFGAELDAELERGRQLYDGIAAEKNIQLPLRSGKGIIKNEKKVDKIIAKDRDIREAAHGLGDLADRPFAKRR